MARLPATVQKDYRLSAANAGPFTAQGKSV
jgi:hypothetical protein